MKNEQYVCSGILLIIMTLSLTYAGEDLNNIRGVFENYNHGTKLERILATWNKSSENSHRIIFHRGNSNLATEISNCIEQRQYEVTENISRGKEIILNCFKATLLLNVLKYVEHSPKSTLQLFNGFLELEKIPRAQEETSENSEGADNCVNKCGRHLREDKRDQYMRMYKKAMLNFISERKRGNTYRNQTEEEREKLLNRVNEKSQVFLSEVIRSIGNEEAEKAEEEKIKREVADPKLLAILEEASKNYLVRLRFYPGVAARMMRNRSGGLTFDLELEDPSGENGDEDERDEENNDEEGEDREKVESDERSTREIKDGSQSKDYDDEDNYSSDYSSNKRKKSKGNKKKKKKEKEKKKKAKKLKKIIPYLLIPMMIQMTLLPFVFKKLFFLAMKALFAGKVALILVGFNLLRNTCIQNGDDFQKIRVEHYGYRRGEEYGAWVNGRSFQESLIMSALNDGFFGIQKPVIL